jgi:hypothetical protein
MAAAHVLGHAGEAFLAREHRMRLVHREEHGRDDDRRDPVELRRLGEEQDDVELFAFVDQAMRNELIARDPGAIEGDDRRPGPRARAQLEEEALPAGPILRRAAYDDVGEFLGDLEALSARELEQLAALGVDRYVVTVFRAAQIQGAALRALHA